MENPKVVETSTGIRDNSRTGLSVFASVIAGVVDVSFVDRMSTGRVILGKSCIIGRVILGLVNNEEIEGRVIFTVARLGLVMVGGVNLTTFVESLDWPTDDVFVIIALVKENTSVVVCIALLVISTVRVDRVFFVEPWLVGIAGNTLLVDAFEKSAAIVAPLGSPPISSMFVVDKLSTCLETMSINSFVKFSNTSPASPSLQLLSSNDESMVTCSCSVFVSVSN